MDPSILQNEPEDLADKETFEFYLKPDLINTLGYLPNFKPKKPLTQAIKQAKLLIQDLRAINLNFEEKAVENKICLFFKALNRLELQFDTVKNALDDQPAPTGLSDLGKYKIQIVHKEDIADQVLSDLMESIADNILRTSIELFMEIKIQGPTQTLMNQVQILIPKVDSAMKIFPYATLMDPTDIFSLKPYDPYWLSLADIMTVKDVGTAQEIARGYKKFLKQIFTAHAMVIQSEKYEGSVAKNTVKYLSGLYYLVNNSEAKAMTDLFISEPKEYIYDVFNMFDSALKPLMSLTLPPIKVNDVVRVDRLYHPITLENLDSALKRNAWTNPDVPLFENLFEPNPQKPTSKFSFKNLIFGDEDKIPIRVISPENLYALDPKDKPQFEELIIYIHGGGWVAMSSFSTQTFTRQWANILGKPIFCIDYRLAPKHKYPAGLDDCWQAYNWIIDNAHKFGIAPNKVILMGDSAGGNLALSLNLLLIKGKRRVPDGLFIPYPGLQLTADYYTPSLMESLTDPVVSYSYLQMFLNSYLEDPSRGLIDPLATSLIIPDEYLKQFPPTKFVVGSKDPLHDDCLRLADRLRKVGCNVTITVYLNMPHGFLIYDLPGGMPQSAICIKDAAMEIKELLKIANAKSI